MSEIERFRIAVPDEDLADLRARLHATRWPETWADPERAYGIDHGFLRDLCATGPTNTTGGATRPS